MFDRYHFLLLTCSALSAVAPVAAHANPQGGVVAAGSAVISESGNTVTIDQSSQRAVIDWRSFNIAPNEVTRFNQPNSSSHTLNRVNDTSRSVIEGTIQANGNITIINPNGVFFARGSVVDVGGLVATSADVSNDAFMAGNHAHNVAGRADAKIVNEGSITVRDAGLAAFVAPGVENHGTITARLGKVKLAAGETFTLDMAGDGHMQVAVAADTLRTEVINTGRISADGGHVEITTTAARDVVDSLITNTGIIEAKAIGSTQGKVTLYAEGSNAVKDNIAANKGIKAGSSTVIHAGSIDVSGRNAGERGGKVEVLGDNIALTSASIIDASGHTSLRGAAGDAAIQAGSPRSARDDDAGSATMTADNQVRTEEDFLSSTERAGGSIKIGGDYLGSGTTAAAKRLFVAEGAEIKNDAIHSGDAGRTIFWSDEDTLFYGNVFARGGVQGGDGGFLETSGKHYLDARGYANLTAGDGYNKGTYLLDPANITIYGNVDPTFVSTDASISLATPLRLWWDATDVNGDFNYANNPADGSQISSWIDKSGKNNHGILAGPYTAPILVENGFNGRPVVRFGGNLDDALDFTSTISDIRTVFWSLKMDAGTTESIYLLGDKFGASRVYNFHGNNAGATMYVGFASANVRNGTTNINGALVNANVTPVPTTLSLINTTTLGNATAGSFSHDIQCCGSRTFDGDLTELIIYNTALSTNSRNLIEQYQSAKWGIALDPVAGAGTEAAEAMGATGYSVFTTRYLERLAETANIVLQADSTITLDLKGDTLNLTGGTRDDKSITLITTNGNIATASAGSITTNRTGAGGNITFTAGGTGSINLNHVLNLSTGDGNITMNAPVNLGAAQNWNAGTGTATFNSTVNGTQNLTLNAGTISFGAVLGGVTRLASVSLTSVNTLTLPAIFANSLYASATGGSSNLNGAGGLVTNGGNINLLAGQDMDLRSLGLISNNGNITLQGGRDVIISTAINAGSASLSVTAGRDIYINTASDLTSGLAAYWGFDEGSGTSAGDTSGNNNTGTLNNGVVWSSTTPSGTGYSLSFDGSNDYVSIADSNSLDLTNGFTLALWMKSGNISQTNRYLLSKRNNAGSDNVYSILYGYSPSNVQYYASGNGYGNPSASSNITVSDTNWHHIIYTYDGSTYNSYKDGILVGSTTLTANAIASTNNLLLGTFNGAGFYYQGLMDDVRIYSNALSATNVAQLYAYNTLAVGSVNAALTAGAVTLNAAADITLNNALNLSGAGTALELVAGDDIINNVGAGVFNLTGGGRFITWSDDPLEDVGEEFFGASTARYLQNYGDAVPPTGSFRNYAIASTEVTFTPMNLPDTVLRVLTDPTSLISDYLPIGGSVRDASSPISGGASFTTNDAILYDKTTNRPVLVLPKAIRIHPVVLEVFGMTYTPKV